jgi:hypothetical protein
MPIDLADYDKQAWKAIKAFWGNRQRAVLTLPGFFRPTKLWDMLVIHEGKLIAAIELKSQVGPSFGNNFNNRTEEAIGNAHDLWTAYREIKQARRSDGATTSISERSTYVGPHLRGDRQKRIERENARRPTRASS